MRRSAIGTIAIFVLFAGTICAAQTTTKAGTKSKSRAASAATVGGDVCADPKLAPPAADYNADDLKKEQPDSTADLPSVIQTVEKALECYQALAKTNDPTQPKGLPKLTSAVMDFKTTTSKTGGITFSVFVFKVGASREKDVTDDLTFTYSAKPVTLPHGFFLAKPAPAPLYAELVKEVQSAASAAQAQSTALGMQLSKVGVMVSYGIKFDGNVAVNVPIQLVTIGANYDYNKNNTQTITLTFGQ